MNKQKCNRCDGSGTDPESEWDYYEGLTSQSCKACRGHGHVKTIIETGWLGVNHCHGALSRMAAGTDRELAGSYADALMAVSRLRDHLMAIANKRDL